jgi:hypothetical protein
MRAFIHQVKPDGSLYTPEPSGFFFAGKGREIIDSA